MTNASTGVSVCTFISSKAEVKTVSVSAPAGISKTDTVTISPAAANKLVYSTQPSAGSGTVAGSTTGFTQPVVLIQDQYGNNTGAGTNSITLQVFKTATCNGSAGTTTLQASDASGFLNAAGTAQSVAMAAAAGTADFTASNIVYTTASTQTAETVYYAAYTSGLLISCSTGFANTNIVPASANKLAFSTQPATNASTAAGAAFTTQPAVQVRDVYGNPRTTDNATSITVTAYKTVGCNSYGASDATGFIDNAGSVRTATLTVGSGTATFSGVTYTYPSTQAAETLYLGATGGGLASTCSNGVRELERGPGRRLQNRLHDPTRDECLDGRGLGVYHAAGGKDRGYLRQRADLRLDRGRHHGLQNTDLQWLVRDNLDRRVRRDGIHQLRRKFQNGFAVGRIRHRELCRRDLHLSRCGRRRNSLLGRFRRPPTWSMRVRTASRTPTLSRAMLTSWAFSTQPHGRRQHRGRQHDGIHPAGRHRGRYLRGMPLDPARIRWR